MFIETELNLSGMCRICLLESAGLNSLNDKFESLQITPLEVLSVLLQIEMDDRLPAVICGHCLEQVAGIYNFKLKCEEAERTLQKLLSQTVPKSEESYKESNGESIDCSENANRDQVFNNDCEGKANQADIEPYLGVEKIDQLKNVYDERTSKDISEEQSTKSETPLCNESTPKVEKAGQIKFDDFQRTAYMASGVKNTQCRICGMKTKKIYELKDHLMQHSRDDDLNNIDFTKVKSLLSKNTVNQYKSREDLITFITTEMKSGNFSEFYSIANEWGTEFNLSDSETDSDSESGKVLQFNYTCELCKCKFDRKQKILCHQYMVHNNEVSPFTCSRCSMMFCSNQLYTYHLKSQCENEQKTLICVCKMRFKWKENLDLHRRFVHSNRNEEEPRVKEKKFLCTTCNKSFFRQEHLDRHTFIHQPDEKKFECSICNRKFNRKDNLKSHMKTHDRNKEEIDKYLCVYCGRKFSNSSNLIVHVRRHTGEKPYKCDICDKGFPRSSDLQCHRRTHTGEKPCLCTICGKGFSRSNKLVRHMRIHTGSKPYKCTYCDRAFTQSNDLTLHVRRHTGDKPYICVVCGDRFIQGTALQNHKRLKGHFEEKLVETTQSLKHIQDIHVLGMPSKGPSGISNASNET